MDKTEEPPAKAATGGNKPGALSLKEKLEALKARQGLYKQLLEGLEKSGESQLSLTDPDSRLMSQGQGAMVGYNVQTAVDAKHSLIVETEVTNHTVDLNELSGMAFQGAGRARSAEPLGGGRQGLL